MSRGPVLRRMVLSINWMVSGSLTFRIFLSSKLYLRSSPGYVKKPICFQVSFLLTDRRESKFSACTALVANGILTSLIASKTGQRISPQMHILFHLPIPTSFPAPSFHSPAQTESVNNKWKFTLLEKPLNLFPNCWGNSESNGIAAAASRTISTMIKLHLLAMSWKVLKINNKTTKLIKVEVRRL